MKGIAPLGRVSDLLGRTQNVRLPVWLSQNNLVALFESYNGLFPIRRLPCLGSALAAKFPAHVERVYFGNLYLKQILHRLADLSFVRARVGNDCVLVVVLRLARALLSEADGLDDLESVHVTPCLVGLPPVQKRAG